MSHKDYGHRDVVDKLGIKPGFAVAIVEAAWPLDQELRARALEQSGRPVAASDEAPDVVLATVDDTTDAVSLLAYWKSRIQPAGGIWLLTPKRGQPGYIVQDSLIDAGAEAGVVDNKVCAVSDTVSAMRFVIRQADRPRKA
jgi:hypothetical protein